MSKKRSAIDLGTNSFRMLIAEVTEHSFRPISYELHSVRLGENFNDSRITSTAIERGLTAVLEFKELLDKYPDIETIACGTAVFRNAINSESFLKKAQLVLGTEIQILTPEKEAYLSRLGTLTGINNCNNQLITIDAGGGSTELSFAKGNASEKIIESDCSCLSISAGAVSLTEEYLGTRVRDKNSIETLRNSTQRLVNKQLENWQISLINRFSLTELKPTLVASGGTATALACLNLNLKEYDASKVQGHKLHINDLSDLLTHLTNLSPQEANSLPGLDNRRGEIVVAGLILLESIMTFWACEQLIITDTGLLEGIILDVKH